MCLAIPGRILDIKDNEASVDFGGVKRPVRIDLVDAKVGDYVIVHTGYAIEVLDEEEALESLKLWRQILSKMDDDPKRFP
ncbi:MAG: HypC/HybG/HupF family hydrogenase formation chaperone [Candidatus Altiarchaeota archaeon]|nr:HypC/HybG/HupF family hydrogenase formation chaperone [Candidatus Altiarchaeota archaeon]